jgi:RimJ/RimL family protein N-acetyltransferase
MDAFAVLSDPRIFDVISEDGMDSVPMPEGPIYLCGYVPELIGCFILHKLSKVTLGCHVQVLPEYRAEHAEEFGRAVIEWTWENTDAHKIVAEIPFLYPNVRRFAERMGFEVEGINRGSLMKGGLLIDQWHMGLRRWAS